VDFNFLVIDDTYLATSSYAESVPDSASIKILNYKTCNVVFTYNTSRVASLYEHIGNGLIAFYTDDYQIRILDAYSLKIKAYHSLSSDIWVGASLNFNGKYLALLMTIPSDVIFVFNITDLSLIRRITYKKLVVSYGGPSYGKLFLYDDYVLCERYDDVLIFSILDGSLVCKLNAANGGHRNKIVAAVLFNSGSFVTGGDSLIKVWDLNKLTLQLTFRISAGGYYESINKMISFSEDYFLTQQYGGDTQLWDYKNGNLIYNFGNSYLMVANINPDFTLPFQVTTNNQIETTTKTISTVKTTTKSMPSNVSYSLITTSSLGQTQIWMMSSGGLNFNLNHSNEYEESVVNHLVIENKYLCTAHRNNFIKLWNLQSKSLIAIIDNKTDNYNYHFSISLEYLGNGLLATNRYKYKEIIDHYEYSFSSIRLWDLNKNYELKNEFNNSNGKYFKEEAAFTYIGNGRLLIKNVFTQNVFSVLDTNKKAYTTNLTKLDFFARINDKTRFAGLFLTGYPFVVRLTIYNSLNLSNVKEFFISDFNSYYFSYQMISIDDDYIAVSSEYLIITININNGNTKCIFRNSHTNVITYLVSIGNGRIASGGADALINIWDVNGCSLITTFDNYEDFLLHDSIKKLVSIDGFYLASLSEYSSIRIWDLNSLSLKYRLNNNDGSSDFSYNDLSFYKIN
jgi:hypothetical protein